MSAEDSNKEYKQNNSRSLKMGKSFAATKFSRAAEEDRQISKFQQPYNAHLTGYSCTAFSDKVKKMCKNNCETSAASFSASKVIILGDASVGKTSIVNRFCHNLFQSNYKATIGVDFEIERFDILNVPYNMQIWDTAGQERFKSIAQSYYRAANVIVVVFDLSSISTMYNCQNWFQEALYASGYNNPLLFLVGTKKDLVSSATLKSLEKSIASVVNSLRAEFWPVSSKSGENIDALFSRIACLAFERILTSTAYESQEKVIGDSISFQRTAPPNKTVSCSGTNCISK